MNNIQTEVDKMGDNLIRALMIIGFSDEEIMSQVKQLGALISFSIQKKADEVVPGEMTPDEKMKSMSIEQGDQIFKDSQTIFSEYVEAITKDLDKEKKEAFFKALSEDVILPTVNK